MIRILIIAGLVLMLGREAAADGAQTKPRLKELVAVAAELVTIGDLVEHAGAAAPVPVFRSPDLGQTGSVPVARVIEALRPHALAGIDTGGLAEVVVTRLSRAITAKDVTERIARACAGRFGLGAADTLAVLLDRDVSTIHVEAGATADLAITRLQVEPRSGRFDVTLDVPGSAAARLLRLRFTGVVTETAEVATLARTIQRGEVIRASDLRSERRPKAEVAQDAIDAEQAIGLAATRPLRAGQVLRPADVARPQLVQRNEPVTIIYEAPGVLLTVRGKAIEAGAAGDIIGVLNVQSNRTVQGKVTGPGRITVAAGIPVAAASQPSSEEAASPPTQ